MAIEFKALVKSLLYFEVTIMLERSISTNSKGLRTNQLRPF